MRDWLVHWDLDYRDTQYYHHNTFEDIADIYIHTELHFPTHKPPATIAIDDRALNFTGDWSDFPINKLLNFKPWHKQLQEDSHGTT